MKQILVRFGERNYLCKVFGVSRPTVLAALSGRCSSELCLRIRRAALNRGGVEVANDSQDIIN